ncbi:MAG TPA: hypothetical protein PLU49_02175 [Saprospiraceae bacterium]|nr:hypothetical protein [Saprospiraceae bacterium]
MKIAAEYIEAGSAIYLGHIINNLSESGFAGLWDLQDYVKIIAIQDDKY